MGEYTKSILAFLALLATNLLAVVVDPTTSAILPQTSAEWATAVLTTIAGTFAVYQMPNKSTPNPK
jgi:hypothetical protein